MAITDAEPMGAVHSVDMNHSDLQQRAEHHAREAERLLAGRLGFINNIIKAGAHATLAVYYLNKSRDAE